MITDCYIIFYYKMIILQEIPFLLDVSLVWLHPLFFCYDQNTHTDHHVILRYFLLSPGEQWDLSSASGGTALTCMVIRPREETHLVQPGQCNRGARIKGRKCEICQLLFINTLGSEEKIKTVCLFRMPACIWSHLYKWYNSFLFNMYIFTVQPQY